MLGAWALSTLRLIAKLTLFVVGIMVLQAESTRWEVAQSAKERIEHDRVKILGTVLNRRKMYIPQWAYRML